MIVSVLMLGTLFADLKARGQDWWTGDAAYRALTTPLYRTSETGFLVQHPWVARLASQATLVLEIGYPVLMAWARTRRVAVIGILGKHLGILFAMRLHSFSLAMGLLTFIAFGLDAEPPDVAGRQLDPSHRE